MTGCAAKWIAASAEQRRIRLGKHLKHDPSNVPGRSGRRNRQGWFRFLQRCTGNFQNNINDDGRVDEQHFTPTQLKEKLWHPNSSAPFFFLNFSLNLWCTRFIFCFHFSFCFVALLYIRIQLNTLTNHETHTNKQKGWLQLDESCQLGSSADALLFEWRQWRTGQIRFPFIRSHFSHAGTQKRKMTTTHLHNAAIPHTPSSLVCLFACFGLSHHISLLSKGNFCAWFFPTIHLTCCNDKETWTNEDSMTHWRMKLIIEPSDTKRK